MLFDQRAEIGRHTLDAAANDVALDLARAARAGERDHLARVDVARQTKGNVGRDALRGAVGRWAVKEGGEAVESDGGVMKWEWRVRCKSHQKAKKAGG